MKIPVTGAAGFIGFIVSQGLLARGDVPDTLADVDALTRDNGFRASTPVQEGVKRFVEWYRSYYHPQTAS